MQNHNFKLTVVDTDSIMFCKPDGSTFSPEEQETLLVEINSLLPEKIHMEHDGIFPRVVVVKSKNYILDNGKKVKFKGSSMIDSKKEPIILDLVHEIGHLLLDDKLSELIPLYHKYIKISQNVKDITSWCTKKTITKSVLEPTRLNEQKVLDALGDKEVQEGDKIHVYYDAQNALQLVENWKPGDESKQRLAKRVFDTFNIFKGLFDIKTLIKYHLKTKQKELELL